MRKINTFWNWFQDNNQTIKNLLKETLANQINITYWFTKHLGYYSKDLDFIILFPKDEKQKTELIITANANPENSNQVIDLIDKAPALRHWKFTAFIQPTTKIKKVTKELSDHYIIPEITIKTNEIKFLPLSAEDKIDIVVYLKNYTISCNTQTWHQVLYIILHDLLGEKPLSQNLNFIQLPQQPNATEELIELYELQLYMDTINKSEDA
ncbi:hypothetical protein ACFS5J_05055 [Flavobacterium chuncheonense]|uniref:Nucleotidyltransferase family protein n=1 Tax=Flavobacterium chuncheonense TaxID=2026653 RepID=A0ABW5YK12_9FLAO